MPPPKKPQKQPCVLAEEVVDLIKKTDDLKHKALLIASQGAELR
jgi:hypothetical protein